LQIPVGARRSGKCECLSILFLFSQTRFNQSLLAETAILSFCLIVPLLLTIHTLSLLSKSLLELNIILSSISDVLSNDYGINKCAHSYQTSRVTLQQGVPRGQQGPLAGCGAAHLGDAKASPAHLPHPAAAGGAREKRPE